MTPRLLRISKVSYQFLVSLPLNTLLKRVNQFHTLKPSILGGSNMTGTDLCVKKPHCAAAVRP